MNSSSSFLESVPVITGLGAYSAGGATIAALWENALKNQIAATLKTFSSGQTFPVYRAPSPSFAAPEKAALRHADRTVHLALAAAYEAWTSSGLPQEEVSPERLGVIIGSSRGTMGLQEKYFSASAKELEKPSTSLYTVSSSIAGLVAKTFHAEGPAFMVSSSCTSGATALHVAAGMIQSGLLDVLLVGGVEAPLVETLLRQYQLTGILSKAPIATEALAPFDQNRSGTVVGEGAAFLVLESAAFAKRRGASILGRLEAVCVATQPRFRVGLDRVGISLQKILHHSLHQATLLPEEIGLLHLHGTGTRLNDLLESQAISTFFGPPEQQPYAWATKAITGHTLGAAALFQVVLTLCALRAGIAPSIPNCHQLDPACRLRLAPPQTILPPTTKALCLTAGFWGNISSIVLST